MNVNCKNCSHCAVIQPSGETDLVKAKDIKVLFRDKIALMFDISVPLLDNDEVNEFDIIKTIFSNKEIVKDDLGYKLVDNNTEQRIEFSEVNDPGCNFQYMVKVQPLMEPKELYHFSNLLNSEKFSDVILSVDGRIIHAHKNILANRSPVFDAMFTHKMDESQSSQVEVKDLDYNTLYDFLHYLYAGKLIVDCTNDVFARYSNLLVAANKYCVENLKGQCEEKLVTVLTTENVLECLALADLHNAVNLKEQAMDFIVGNANKIIELPLYRSFLLSHPGLSIEIVRALVVEKNNLESAVAETQSSIRRIAAEVREKARLRDHPQIT